MVLRQRLFLTIVLLANLGFWAFPSEVVRLVAEDDHVLLGCYSREHFAANVAVLAVSAIGLYIDRAPDRSTYKRRWFQVVAVFLFASPILLSADLLLRRPATSAFVEDTLVYRRPPHATFKTIFEDRPNARRSYLNSAKGYPPVDCTLRTDARGFRNASAEDGCDVLVLGDSFAEGAGVSDEHPWPVKFAAYSGLSVYNLGMCGYTPDHYLLAYQKYGAALQPRFVICLLYEGNDLRPPRPRDVQRLPTLSDRWRAFVRNSPIRADLDRFFIETFGPIGANWNLRALDTLSWLPLRIPDGPEAKAYAFRPIRFMEAYRDPERFRSGGEWRRMADFLQELLQKTQQAGATLVVAYAPAKAHALLPLVWDRLPPEKVRAFLTLRTKQLPEPDMFMGELRGALEIVESAVRRWCEDASVPFFTTTPLLRIAAAEGHQVYFTYDNHWTPEGHEVVARGLAEFWADQGWSDRHTHRRPAAP